MDRQLPRCGRAMSAERVSYCDGVGVGRKSAASAPPDFSRAAYCQVRAQSKALKLDLFSTPSDDSTREEDSFPGLSNGRLCKKIDGTPMNKISNEELSREKRRSSPSVIAKLMGLDELPSPQVVTKLQNGTGHFRLKKSFAGLQEKYKCSGNCSLHVSRREQQKAKIVPEPFDSEKSKKRIDKVVHKEKRHLNHDMAFIRQQFMEAKCLSTNEVLQNSKELNDVLDILDENKDVFLKFLREPNSLFAKHLHELQLSNPFAHTSHIMNLEISEGRSQENGEHFYRSMKENKGCIQKQNDFAHCCTKQRASLGNHATNDHMDSLLCKLLRSQYSGKNESSTNPTSIVVLKPSVEKARSKTRTESLPTSLEHYQQSCRRHQKFHQKLLVERGEQHQLFDYKTKWFKTMGTRENTKNMSRQVKQSLRNCSIEGLASDIDKYDSLSTCLSESSLSREAMKLLSERWKINLPYSEGLVGECSSTFGQMLSLSNRGAPRTLHQLILQNAIDEKVDKEDINDSWDYPSGISNRDGWKDKCDASLSRSEDLKKLSSIYGASKHGNRQLVHGMRSIDDSYMLKDVLNLEQTDLLDSNTKMGNSLLRNFKYRDGKPRLFRSCGEEHKKPSREVELCQDESRNSFNLNDHTKLKPVYSRLMQRNMDDVVHLVHNSSNVKGLGSNTSFLAIPKDFHQLKKYANLQINVLGNEVAEGQVAPVDSHPVECPLDGLRESGALVVPKSAEWPSPVSVLELPSEDGKSTPECFERICAGLQNLRTQLNLLELEPVDCGDEHAKSLFLGNEASRNIFKSLKIGDYRDFSYLLDVLTVSGIFAVSQKKHFDAFYLPDNPVFPDVFDKLEKKHNLVDLWSRSERKLLFDLINSILAEVLAPCMDLHPWVKSKRIISCDHEKLVHESWRMLVLQQKELSTGKPEEKVLDTRWLYLDDDVNKIGREIERILKDNLLDELVSEFILG